MALSGSHQLSFDLGARVRDMVASGADKGVFGVSKGAQSIDPCFDP